jgi:hypothetical protein
LPILDVFAGLRGDDYPSAGVIAGGVFGGARKVLAYGLGATGMLSFEGFKVGSTGYHAYALVLSAGVDWRQ